MDDAARLGYALHDACWQCSAEAQVSLVDRILRFVLGWAWTFLASGTALALMLLAGRRAGDWSWRFIRPAWAKGALRIVRCRLDIEGAEHLRRPAIIAANHQSFIDVVFFPAILPRQVKFVAKSSLRQVPLWGWVFGLTPGALLIDRSSPKSAVRVLEDGLRDFPEGWSVCIFPEGTRSRDLTVAPFKRGIVRIAKLTGLPVVPVGFADAHDCMDTGVIVPRPATIYVTFGPPIPTGDWSLDDPEPHLEQLREVVQELVDVSAARREEQTVEAPSPIPRASAASR